VLERFDWGIGVLGRARYLAELLEIPLDDAAEVSIAVDKTTGRLNFVSRRISLDDLRRHFETLIRMFRFAEKHGLWLWIEREID